MPPRGLAEIVLWVRDIHRSLDKFKELFASV